MRCLNTAGAMKIISSGVTKSRPCIAAYDFAPLRIADILLNPSITEAFGNVTLEAMACGLPVVAANATGATNLVRHGHTGMLVEASDIDGFADVLERYVRDPERRARHGAAGLKVARTMDWDHINSAVIKTYIRAISKRERIARLTGR